MTEDRLSTLRRRHGAGSDEELLDLIDTSAPAYVVQRRADLAFGAWAEDLLPVAEPRHPWATLVCVWAAFTARLTLDRTSGPCDDPRESSLSIVARVRSRFAADNDARGILYADYAAGCIELAAGALTEAERWLARVIDPEDGLGTPDAVVPVAMAHRALALWALGQVGEAYRVAGLAAALAVGRSVPRAEAIALMFLAAFNVMAGELEVAATNLTAAKAAQDRIQDPLERFDEPLHDAIRGMLDAVHGREREAVAAFERAVQGPVQYAAVAAALRAEFLPDWQPDATRLVTRELVATLDDVGERGWLCHWARRAHAIACRETGELDESIGLLEDLLNAPLTPLDRGRTLLALGDSLLRAEALRLLRPGAGPAAPAAPAAQRAGEHLRAAITEFDGVGEGFGAGYWVARACARLAGIDRTRYRSFERRAHGIIQSAPARARLHGTARLRIQMLGEPQVLVHGRPAAHGAWRASLLLYALALAGGSLSHDRLAEMLWPDELDADRLRRNLKTARYQAARLVLGPEHGWRLGIVGDSVRLDLTGVRVDVAEARLLAAPVLEGRLAGEELRAAGEHVLEALAAPLLAPWADLAWVAAEQEALRRRAERVAEALARHGARSSAGERRC